MAEEAAGPGTAEPVEVPGPEVRNLFGLAWGGVVRFAEMLEAEGELRGLIGPREVPRLWSRHIVNSAAVVPFVPEQCSVADVGSGAGFPGVVLALMRPDSEVHLVEPMERRVTWLLDVVAELDLDNVTVHRVRAEELHKRARFDVVSARAVAAMDKLARWTMPLVAPGGALLALKGERAAEEVGEAKYVLKKLGAVSVDVHEVASPMGGSATTVVEVRKRA
ncbi:16S rRNA (guanine(527)-N(7))-methyltransferase RsmG [Georgenia wangjunii]|uniref:16S rRNA (guanine(527)-N(7))-methyltransferase RsmG n=1 Tax=Georgenia wangjunii TaxID=3117730 RepID=UPI002F266775